MFLSSFQGRVALAALALFTSNFAVAELPRSVEAATGNPHASLSSAVLSAPAAGALATANPVAAVVEGEVARVPDPCALLTTAANATRPAWDYAASSTQCGVLESDSGFLAQPVGGGVEQNAMVSSLRYGLTPRLDLRWAITNHIWQSGGGTASVEGTGDQWLGLRYRFVEQGRIVPAMAFLYTGKIPAANPAKGLGSGFVDHQILFIASRDIGKDHFDFNCVGTLIGEKQGHEGAAQFGLALTRPVTAKLSAILESYGGPQPGVSGRFGAGLTGATYTLRPQLVLDAAYSRTYTAGSPRQQMLVGFTFARRSGFSTIPRGSAFGRFLGR